MAKKSLALPLQLSSTPQEVTLNPRIFNVSAPSVLLAQYVRVYLANKKATTAKTKTRSEVNASTKKIYRQKGTGRARHGAKSAPIFVGGGTAHGPKNLHRTLKMPKKMRRRALFAALSAHVKQKSLFIIDDSALQKTSKTQKAHDILEKLIPNYKKITVVFPHKNETKKYFVNLPHLQALDVCDLNAYIGLNSTHIVFSHQALNEFVTRFKETAHE